MILKTYSWNINGIRSAAKKGFFDWLRNSNADIVLLQEVRAEPIQIPKEYLDPFGYKSFWHPAKKKGIAGLLFTQDFLLQKRALNWIRLS